jgi:acyl-CoA synthetase (NDP forming)
MPTTAHGGIQQVAMKKAEAKQLVKNARASGRHVLREPEAKALVAAWGIPVPRSVLIEGLTDDLAGALKALTPPLVLKVVSQDIMHKRDVGGVITGIKDYNEVRTAVMELQANLAVHAPRAQVDGFLVEEMIPAGIELILGGLRDPQFGPAVVFGTGGFAVELVKDVSFRLAPLTREEALAMMQEIKSYPLLIGFRGSKPVNLEELAAAVIALGNILLELEEIQELEINPLVVSDAGAVAVDARVILG